MDCSNLSGLTLSDAFTCMSAGLSQVGTNIGNIPLTNVLQSIVGLAMVPCVIGSFELVPAILRRVWHRTRGVVFKADEQTDATRHNFIKRYSITGLIGFVCGVNFDNAWIAFPGLYLMICAAFFILIGKQPWGKVECKEA